MTEANREICDKRFQDPNYLWDVPIKNKFSAESIGSLNYA